MDNSFASQDAKKAYLERCFKMTHAELYAELMRVHTEANRLIQEAVKQEREECAKLFDDASEWDEDMSRMIRARGQA